MIIQNVREKCHKILSSLTMMIVEGGDDCDDYDVEDASF